MAKISILLLIALAALELFNFSFLGANLTKSFQMAGIGMLFIILIVNTVYQKEVNFEKHFNFEVFIILLGVILSMFMAQWGHDQPISTTLVAQRFMYFYLLYWVLHSVKPNIEDIEKIILWLGIAFSILYLIQFIAYPTVVFDVRIAPDRGTVRIFLAGFSFLVLAYFLTLNKLFEDFSLGRLFSILLFISILILMGTRQVIFSVMLLTLMNILFSKKVKSKILIVLLVSTAIVPVIILFQDIFLNLIDLSKTQSESVAENVRIRAAIFFLTELFPNTFSYFTGNGADSTNSYYGFLIQMYRDAYGFYQSDIGIIGDYTKFGALFLIGAFSILFRIIFGRLAGNSVYIRFFLISVLLTLFTGGGPFGQADSIVAICFILYIIDVNKHEEKYEQVHEEQVEETEDAMLSM
jgi:hypothetical protein